MFNVKFWSPDAMDLIRLHDLTLSERGLWLSLMLVMAAYPDPDNRQQSEPLTMVQIAKLVGSRRATVEAGLATLKGAELIGHAGDYNPLFNGAPWAVDLSEQEA